MNILASSKFYLPANQETPNVLLINEQAREFCEVHHECKQQVLIFR